MNNLEEFLKVRDKNTKKSSQDVPKREPLGTKTAIELLLSGKLKERVCKFCLHIDSNLYEFDEIFEIMGNKTVPVKVTVKDMIGTIYPFEISKNPNLPNSVCNTCINRIISCYLFAQQCDQAERALNNCIDDVYDKTNRLDPMDKPKTRGRQKLNPNTNVIYAEFDFVIDYADPLMTLISHGNIETEEKIGPLECKKCWKVFPNMEQLLNHETIHPKTMWYSCRICGLSMPKINTYKKHIKNAHNRIEIVPVENKMFCKCACGNETENYSEHLQHIEKHKFKVIMQHALDGNMDKLCSVCLEKKSSMTQLGTNIRLHGGYPEITGNQSLSNIVSKALPDKNQQNANKYRPLPFTNVAEMMKLKLKSFEKKKKQIESTDVINDSQKKSNIINTEVENINKEINKVKNKEIISKNKFEFSLPGNVIDFIKKETKTNITENGVSIMKPTADTIGIKSLCLCYSKFEKNPDTNINDINKNFKIGQKRMIFDKDDESFKERFEDLSKKRKIEVTKEINNICLLEIIEDNQKKRKIEVSEENVINDTKNVSSNCSSEINNIGLDLETPKKLPVLNISNIAVDPQSKIALTTTDRLDNIIRNEDINIPTSSKFNNESKQQLKDKLCVDKNENHDNIKISLLTSIDESKERLEFKSYDINNDENNYNISHPTSLKCTDESKQHLGHMNKDENKNKENNINKECNSKIQECPKMTSESVLSSQEIKSESATNNMLINKPIIKSVSQQEIDSTIYNFNIVASTPTTIKKQEVHTGTQTEKIEEIKYEPITPVVVTPKHIDFQPQPFLFNMPSFTNVVEIMPPVHIEETAMDIDDFASHHSANNVEFSMKPEVNLVHSFSLPNIPINESVEQPIKHSTQNWGPTPTIPSLQFSMGTGNVKKEPPQKNRRFIKAKRRHN